MIVIQNGRVFDGTGADGVTATVVVSDGVVQRVTSERVDVSHATRVIDAEGMWVMPGFLDTHTHYDAEILEAPGLGESVRHGVTTVFIGSCSLSTILSTPEDCADVFSRVEALPHDEVLDALRRHKTWSTPSAYAQALDALPLGPNVASFLGHSDMRVAAMGLQRAVDPDARPSAAENAQMEAALNDALDSGFLGMSVMTNPWDKVGGERFRSAKLPSTYATWAEYRRLNRVLRRRDAILQGAPNITTKYNVLAFIAETSGYGVRKPLKTTLISAADTKADPWLAALLPATTSATNTLLRGDLRWQTVPMPFEVYADGMDLVVSEEFGSGEAALHLADEVARNALLVDEAYRRQFRKDYEKRWTSRVWHRDFYDATVVEAPDATLVGQSFGEIADARGLHPVDAFLDVVVEYGTALRWRTTIANHRPEVLAKLASHPSVQVGFSDSGAHVRNMAFYNFALYYLRSVLRSHEAGAPVLPLGEAIRKVTAEQADWFGVDAGYLREGDRADIVIVNPDGLDDTLGAYHEAPMPALGGLSRMVRRNDAAVHATLIAGEVVYETGTFVDGFGRDKQYGRFLRASNGARALASPQPDMLEAAE